MENKDIASPDALEMEIEEARTLVMYAYSLWVKGDYKPKDKSREDLVNLEVNFRIADSAIEYDCNTSILGVTDYCVHFMSRTPTLTEEKLQEMKEFAGELKSLLDN